MQGAAQLIQHYEHQLHASRTALAQHLADALPLPAQPPSPAPQLFITVPFHTSLCSSVELVKRLAEDAKAADGQHSYSSSVPSWAQALSALQQAAAQAQSLQDQTHSSRLHAHQASPQAGAEGEQGEQQPLGQALSQRWQEQVEEAVKSMLLWAQNVQSSEEEQTSDQGTAPKSHRSGVAAK